MDELIECQHAEPPSFSLNDQPLDPTFYTEHDESSWFSLNDGWSRKSRVRYDLRRPGARHSFDCDDYDEYEDPYYTVPVQGSRQDLYLASKFPDLNTSDRFHLLKEFSGLADHQYYMLHMEPRISEDSTYFHPRCKRERWQSKGSSALWEDIRRAVKYVVVDCDFYAKHRMRFIRRWFNYDYDDYTQMPTPEQQRQFETEAWYWDRGHKRVLAARRRLARVVIGRLLRMAVKRSMIALYWQERTQRALCAPGGAGRAADAVAFESEFA